MDNHLKDEHILRQALDDPSYFSILVDKYQVPFIRKALGIVRSKEEAEDIVQETFVKIYNYGHKFKKEEGIEFKSWAYKILMNTAFTHYQKVKKTTGHVEYLDPMLYDEKPDEHTEDFASVNDARSAVKSVIEKMPEHLARVLRLYYLEDKSYKDICKIEKISVPTLKMRLFRAKRMFERISVEVSI
ncbi:MAG: RNA polymerase sigma factor [bacterium]|nr:RNA polymerase sigma factor [bacterium]